MIVLIIKVKKDIQNAKLVKTRVLSSKVITNTQSKTRVCGVIVSTFARRWGGDGFNSQPKQRHS